MKAKKCSLELLTNLVNIFLYIMRKFKPGDYVVTLDGKRGYIVDHHAQNSNYYSIRLTHGYIFKSDEELELDFSVNEKEEKN